MDVLDYGGRNFTRNCVDIEKPVAKAWAMALRIDLSAMRSADAKQKRRHRSGPSNGTAKLMRNRYGACDRHGKR